MDSSLLQGLAGLGGLAAGMGMTGKPRSAPSIETPLSDQLQERFLGHMTEEQKQAFRDAMTGNLQQCQPWWLQQQAAQQQVGVPMWTSQQMAQQQAQSEMDFMAMRQRQAELTMPPMLIPTKYLDPPQVRGLKAPPRMVRIIRWFDRELSEKFHMFVNMTDRDAWIGITIGSMYLWAVNS